MLTRSTSCSRGQCHQSRACLCIDADIFTYTEILRRVIKFNSAFMYVLMAMCSIYLVEDRDLMAGSSRKTNVVEIHD